MTSNTRLMLGHQWTAGTRLASTKILDECSVPTSGTTGSLAATCGCARLRR